MIFKSIFESVMSVSSMIAGVQFSCPPAKLMEPSELPPSGLISFAISRDAIRFCIGLFIL